MKKLTKEAKAALQSARAKNRKQAVTLGNAAAEHDINVPKHVITKINALNEWYDAQLNVKPVVVEIATEAEVAEAMSEAA